MTEDVFRLVDAIPGWLSQEEAALLYNSIIEGVHLPGRVVEIGSFVGRSTACMALAIAANAELQQPVLAIDPHRGSPEHQPGQPFHDPQYVDPVTGAVDTYPRLEDNLVRLGVRDQVEVWRMSSSEAVQRFHEEARLVLIDGDHDFTSVCFDCRMWGAKLSASGLLLVHDYEKWAGPTEAVDMLLRSEAAELIARARSLVALRMLPSKSRNDLLTPTIGETVGSLGS